MAQVQTVLGPVDGAQLGVMLSHEHVLISMGEDARHYPWMFDRERTRANVVRELREAKAGGVGTIVELTTPDLGRDVAFYRDVAREAGINIVAATGIWRDIPRSFWSRDPDAIADIFVREIEVGIEDTGIKAGVIKVANDAEGVTPEGELVLRGRGARAQAARAARSARTTGRRRRSGGGRSRSSSTRARRWSASASATARTRRTSTTSSRCCRRACTSRWTGTRAARAGRTWRERNATVKALVERGWVHRLMLGHDHAPSPVLAARRAGRAAGAHALPVRADGGRARRCARTA